MLYGSDAANQLDLAQLELAMAAWEAGDLEDALLSLGTLTDDLERDSLRGNQGNDELIAGVGDVLHA